MKLPIELLAFLKSEDGFIIATHINPDGDGIGSAIALSEALHQMGKRTLLLCRDAVPYICKYLPGSDRFFTYETVKTGAVDIASYKNLVLVDCNHPSRTGMDKVTDLPIDIRKSAVIDHHETDRDYGDIRWIQHEAPATAMMIYALIKELGAKMSKEIADNIYAGILVDTGNFRHDNTSAEVLRTAADLVDAGAEPTYAYRSLFESWSNGRFLLFIKTLDTMEIIDGVAIVTITRKMFEETGTTADDTENFVEFPRIMKDINVSVFLRELDADGYKVSLRSKGGFNVAKIAAEFGGGGHKNAAGCTVKGDLQTVKRAVLSRIKAS
ncbi:MAG: bifunctional oligoribonuclease/PAP phosphatase NrnA [Nitrospirae bacterium]|nr:MAG: bifunctional oligoribonuclease/PAP phosphatase NrnA [Nitrospirota bacterium]